jgi:putative ABC transport system permease protein
MILREIRRFLRRGYLAAILASIILTLGFSGAAITLNVIRVLIRPQGAGLENLTFATIAQQTPSGGLSRIDWYAIEHLRNTLSLPGSSMVAYAPPAHYQLQWQERSAPISIAFTESEFFSKFTRGLYAGHNFALGEKSLKNEGEAIVSEEFGRRFFGTASSALHQNIRINGQSFTVIGVAPKGFGGLWTPTDVWTTPDQWESLATTAFRRTDAINPVSWKVASIWYFLIATNSGIRPGPVEALATQLRGEKDQLFHLHIVSGLTNDPVHDRNIHKSSQLSLIVAIALLLSASLNYCILLFSRSSLSIEEFRLKRVLGANLQKLALDAAVGPFFVVFASLFMSGIVTVFVQHMLAMRATNPVMAVGLLGVGSAVKMLAIEFPLAGLLGALIALAPFLSLLRRSGTPRTGATITQTTLERRILNGIVVLEITICTLVCLFAGTFVREYYLLSKVNLGFDPQRLTSYAVGLNTKEGENITIQTTSGEDSPIAAFVRLSTFEAREHLSGLQSIAAASCTPFGPPMNTIDVYRFQSWTEPLKAVSFCTVSQNFFSTIGTHIDKGSGFTAADYDGDVNHVVINRSLAKALWRQQDALNQTIRLDMPDANLRIDASIVGIAADIRQEGALSSPEPTVYVPLTGNALVMSFPLYFLARGTQSPEKFGDIVQKQSQSTVSHLSIVRTYPIEKMIHTSWQEQNLRLKLALFGAIIVACIAYVGLYGVLIHSASVRQKELALRLVFGASNWALQRIVLEKTLLCCFTAICLSLLLWKACFSFLNPQWMSGASWSWKASIITALLCAAFSVVISFISARRVTRITPVALLKEE